MLIEIDAKYVGKLSTTEIVAKVRKDLKAAIARARTDPARTTTVPTTTTVVTPR